MRARQIQLHNVGARLHALLADFLPVFLNVANHHGSHDHPVRKVSLQFMHGFAPICCSLLGNQLNVQKAGLVRTVLVRVGPTDNSWRHVGDQVLIQRKCLSYCETPACLERSANHRSGCAARGTCETEWIGEPYACHCHRHIHVVNCSMKQRQLRGWRDHNLVQALKILVNRPRRKLPLVGCFNCHGRTSNVAASKQPRSTALALAIDH
mmetsp:Transcript_6753/g.16552  ORF Transcript_6753/g.16552 Transcript_6753/m.16552 type:complete len:209 (-) Transcript_6753:1496-2122(-)